MKVLVVGGGGREHAIVRSCGKAPACRSSMRCPATAAWHPTPPLCPRGKGHRRHGGLCQRKGHRLRGGCARRPLALGAVDALRQAASPALAPTKGLPKSRAARCLQAAHEEIRLFPPRLRGPLTTRRRRLPIWDTAPIPPSSRPTAWRWGKGGDAGLHEGGAKAAVHAMMGERVFGESARASS